MLLNELLKFSTFFFAYAVFLLLSYKTDPRYTLKYTEKTSFYRISKYSVVNRLVFLTILLVLSLSANQDLIEVFGFKSIIPTQIWVPLGFLVGLLTFFLGMPINLLIRNLQAKTSFKNSRREEEILKIMFKAPLHPNEFIAFLGAVTVINGLIEETIFRGFLLTCLKNVFPPAITVLIQAAFFFIPSLYQGIPNALLVLYRGIVLGTFLLLSGSIFVAIVARLTADAIGLFIQAKTIKEIAESSRKS